MSRAGWPSVALCTALLAAPLIGAASAEGPLPGHTGGFGEPTCADCHQGPGPAAAGVALIDLPDAWSAGEAYTIAIEVRADGLRRGGFQLAARWADGPDEGGPAGRFEISGGGMRITESGGIGYAHHTYDGTRAGTPGHVRWTLIWRAPSGGAGDIAFHVAANAANDDNSEFGDSIVTASAIVPSAATGD